MRCANCGNRISDAVAATNTECPKCGKPLRPSQEGTAAASEDSDSLALTEAYIPAAGPPEGEAPAAQPAEKKDVTDTGAQRARGGAYTKRFDLDDMPAAGRVGAASASPDTAKTAVSRDKATTHAKPDMKAAAEKGPAPTPEKLGHFVIRGKLGEGGMGEVLDGHDPQLDRRVAIKVLSPKLAQDDAFVQRFLSEARAVARVAHVNVAGIYFADSDGDRHFFAMEFIEGKSLDELVEEDGPPTPKASIGHVIQAVRGLAAAHERGIVHRDIKPANLMLGTDGVIKVTDFGLAKRAGEDLKLTQAGSVMGSPHFMAPEQGRGEETDVRADIYSLGATLYHLLTGKTPYDGDSAVAVILKHQEAPVPQILRAPPSVNRLLSRMMAKGREQRYQSYANLMTDLVRLDKSGLLREDVTLDQAAAATEGSARMASPAAAPPAKMSTGLKTQKADDEAVLLSQLDAVMKHAPSQKKGSTLATRKVTASRIRSAAIKVTKRILRPDASAEEEEAEAGEEGAEFRPLPIGLIALGALLVILLLVVIALKPWSWGRSETGAPAGPTESPELLKKIDTLRPALKHELPEARRNAVMALAGYPGPTAEKLLVVTLADPDPMVRAEVAKALGEIGGERNVRWYVVRLLSDASPDVRRTAAEVLQELTGYPGDLTRINWASDPEDLRRTVREEFETWLKRQ